MKVITLDCETTGLDRHHGADPFLISSCDTDWQNTYWQFEVDPHTRRVIYDPDMLKDIASYIQWADLLVFHNAKFDVGMMYPLLKPYLPGQEWPWYKTEDTILSSHLLDSRGPHDLTSLALKHLNIDVRPYDDRCKRVVSAIRQYINTDQESELGEWRIARHGMACMPSAGDNPWKYDLWLPAALLKHLEDHDLPLPDPLVAKGVTLDDLENSVLEYANSDTTVTLGVYQEHQQAIKKQGLKPLYETRLQLIPVIWEMEDSGVTGSRYRLEDLHMDYKSESVACGRVCVNLAKTYDGYELKLPKSGVNDSVREFLIDKLKLPAVAVSKKTGQPSFNKDVLEAYRLMLPENSKELLFIEKLMDKRKRDTAISYMEGYSRFYRDIGKGWFVLYPSLNPTGSATLRFTSSNPNEQNISKREGFNLRYIFGPPPGFEWWSMDAKNIELRLPAYESGEEELIALFENPDEPPYYGSNHLLNFHTVYPDIWESELAKVGIENVGPHCKKKYASSWYQRCKNGGFAVQYGAVYKEGKRGTADRAFGKDGAHKKLKERFGKLETLNRKWIEFAREHGYVETMPDKEVDPTRGYPIRCTTNEWGGIVETVPLNYHVQGTAMWWMCKAMIRCQEQIEQWRYNYGVNCRIVMQVHDELVFEFPKGKDKFSNIDKIRVLAELMAQGGEDVGVPTPVGAELHTKNWSEGETVL